ncbi:hypothetical protein [Actinomadura sp. CNU-125]|uniref:hypothetical protein n=1 Tax=Actinomadura sp. CNU-125 TaxID=1904961 RepID=UPI0021CCA9BC|nr:hypothetical protein [Actinomadura sp. CNU-125]
MSPSRAAIVGVHNTAQARRLEGATSHALAIEAALGALADAGLAPADVDGVNAEPDCAGLIYDLSLGPAWQGRQFGTAAVPEAVHAVEAGEADVVLLVAAAAGATSTTPRPPRGRVPRTSSSRPGDCSPPPSSPSSPGAT